MKHSHSQFAQAQEHVPPTIARFKNILGNGFDNKAGILLDGTIKIPYEMNNTISTF